MLESLRPIFLSFRTLSVKQCSMFLHSVKSELVAVLGHQQNLAGLFMLFLFFNLPLYVNGVFCVAGAKYGQFTALDID